jgi:two-component system, sensor histidine kinase
MMPPPTIPGEGARLDALRRYAILDSEPEADFDEIVTLAATMCSTPIALISLIDQSRQWFKSVRGLDQKETPRDISFCAHAISGNDLFIITDATLDARFAQNPLVVGDPRIRFYAGAPLTTPDGHNLGTLCVIDGEPRVLTCEQESALRSLARQVMAQLELRLQSRELRQVEKELASQGLEVERMKRDFVSTVSHELRTPLTSIHGSLGLLASGVMGRLDDDAQEMVAVAERNSVRLIALINDILDFEKLPGFGCELPAGTTASARSDLDQQPCNHDEGGPCEKATHIAKMRASDRSPES